MQNEHDLLYIAFECYSPSIMHSSTVGRAAMMSSRPKPEIMKVTNHETLLLILSHRVEPVEVPLC